MNKQTKMSESFSDSSSSSYTPSRVKPLRIVEKDKLDKLREQKRKLKQRLKEMDGATKQLIPTIMQPQPQQSQIYQQQKENKRPSGGGGQTSVAELRRQQLQEQEKTELKQKILHLEKEKKVVQVQFEKMKEGIRFENMQLKEQSIKNKVEAQSVTTRRQELEIERGNNQRDLKKLRGENQSLQNQMLELSRRSAELEATNKQIKEAIYEREDRVKWMESRLQEEEGRHRQTLAHCSQLKNQVQNQQQEISQHIRDRERLCGEMEMMQSKCNQKYEDLHEVKLRNQRDLNEAKLQLEEYRKIMNQQSEKCRVIELERERVLCKLDDFERIQSKLAAREREVIELEVEIDRLKRLKGTHIIERVVESHPVAIHQQPIMPQVISPIVSEDIVDLREQLLYLTQDRNRYQDEAEYWRRRYSEVEEAGDRAVHLISHQNIDQNAHIQKNSEWWERRMGEVKMRIMALINDLNGAKRQSGNEEVKQIIQEALGKNSDLIQFLQQQQN